MINILSEQLADLSRSYLQKLLKDGGVEVNGKPVKSNYKLADKDQICLEVPEAVEPEIAAEPMDLDILYEDKDIILMQQAEGHGGAPGCRSLYRNPCECA